MKIDFNVKKERTKVDKCIRHLDATLDLFSNSIKSIESVQQNKLYWANIELVNRTGKSIHQRYSFSSEGERDVFIKEIIKAYKTEV